MKKRLFFSLLLFPFIGAVNLATVFTMSGCVNNAYYRQIVRIVNKNDTNSQTNYSKLNQVKVSFNNLFSGTKKYNNGNYVLIVGSIADKNNNSLVSSGSGPGNCENGDWAGVKNILDTLSKIKDDQSKTLSVNLLIYEDINPPLEDYQKYFKGLTKEAAKNLQTNWVDSYFKLPSGATDSAKNYAASPFLKYSSDKQVKQVSKDWHGKYVRNDDSAKTYRSIIEYIKELNLLDSTNFSEISPIVVLSKWDAKTSQVKIKVEQPTTGSITSDITDFYKQDR